jgi:uncharacterized membrane protein YgcG
MPLVILALVFATALVIVTVMLVSPHMQRRRLARNDGTAYSGDTSWNPAMFSGDGGGSDCSAGDTGGGCDGGGDGGGGGV